MPPTKSIRSESNERSSVPRDIPPDGSPPKTAEVATTLGSHRLGYRG